MAHGPLAEDRSPDTPVCDHSWPVLALAPPIHSLLLEPMGGRVQRAWTQRTEGELQCTASSQIGQKTLFHPL